MIIVLGLCSGLSASGRGGSSSPARLPAPLAPAPRSRRRRSAYQSKDHEEAVLQVWNTSADSEDHVLQLVLCKRMWMWM